MGLKKISQKFEDFSSSSEDDSESYEDSLFSAILLDSNELEWLNNEMADRPSIDLLMKEADDDLDSGVLASNFTENEDGFVMSNEDSKRNQTSIGKSICT